MRLLNHAGGVIEDWPGLKSRLSMERQRRESLEADGGMLERGRAPALPELEEAWFGLERKGYVSVEYEKLNIKRISKQEVIPERGPEGEVIGDEERNALNLACDVLSCLFILPGAVANSIFGPFSLAFALAMTGSRRKWGVLRVIGVIFGSILAVAFFYNAFR